MIEIKVFFLVLSILYLIKYTFEIVVKLFQTTEPEPLKLNVYEKIMIYVSLAYTLTFIILSI